MLIYCDSMIVIYYFDHTGSFNLRAARRLAAVCAAGDVLAVSDLVRLEYRITPLQNGDAAKLALSDNWYTRPPVQVVPITSAVFDRAATIRAAHKFKLGDSLHLAAAIEARCDPFLTNDGRLSAFTGLAMEVLP